MHRAFTLALASTHAREAKRIECSSVLVYAIVKVRGVRRCSEERALWNQGAINQCSVLQCLACYGRCRRQGQPESMTRVCEKRTESDPVDTLRFHQKAVDLPHLVNCCLSPSIQGHNGLNLISQGLYVFRLSREVEERMRDALYECMRSGTVISIRDNVQSTKCVWLQNSIT